jgi:hypothetical protein
MMKRMLKNNPLMTYRGLSSWPPTWTWVGGVDNQHPKGEVGILEEIKVSQIEPMDRIFPYMEYEAGVLYRLSLDRSSFLLPPNRSPIAGLLRASICEIGETDLSHTLYKFNLGRATGYFLSAFFTADFNSVMSMGFMRNTSAPSRAADAAVCAVP